MPCRPSFRLFIVELRRHLYGDRTNTKMLNAAKGDHDITVGAFGRLELPMLAQGKTRRKAESRSSSVADPFPNISGKAS